MQKSCLAIVLIFAISRIPVSLAAETPIPGCAADDTLNVCVTSGSLNLVQRNNDGSEVVKVSLTLQIINKTNTPLQLSYIDKNGQSAFMPKNAEGISDDYQGIAVSGLNTCSDSLCNPANNSNRYTTLAPGYPLRVQIIFKGRITISAVTQIQAADMASYSASLAVIENGHQKFVPLPVSEFKFGNGLR